MTTIKIETDGSIESITITFSAGSIPSIAAVDSRPISPEVSRSNPESVVHQLSDSRDDLSDRPPVMLGDKPKPATIEIPEPVIITDQSAPGISMEEL